MSILINIMLYLKTRIIQYSKRNSKKDNGEFQTLIEFKIRFRDLLGNLYEQRFEFGYDNYIVKGFNLKSSSGIPRFIEE